MSVMSQMNWRICPVSQGKYNCSIVNEICEQPKAETIAVKSLNNAVIHWKRVF